MDAGYVCQVRRSERSPGGLDDGAFVDAREGERAHCESDGACVDDRIGGMVAEHEWSNYRAGGLLRCEGEKRFCEVSRQAEGRDCHLPGGGEPFSTETGRSACAEEPADAAASSANWRAAGGGSVRSFLESGQGANGVLEARRCGGGGWRLVQTAPTTAHQRTGR